MKLDSSDISELRPIIAATVQAVLTELDGDRAKVSDRLAIWEPEAAALIGVQPHALRDARLRGEIAGSRVGKRVVYQTSELLKFLGRARA